MDYQKQGKDFLDKNGICFSAIETEYNKPDWDNKNYHQSYKITLTRKKDIFSKMDANKLSRFSIKFWQSIVDTGSEPTEYDVLSCLTKNDPVNFESFCAEYGYDIDSRKAEKTFKEVLKEWKKISGFFTEKEIEELKEIN